MYYWQWTNRGFFSELSLLMYAKILSECEGQPLLCDFSKSNIGSDLSDYLSVDISLIQVPIMRGRSVYGRGDIFKSFKDYLIRNYFCSNFVSHDELFRRVWNKDFENKLKNDYGVDFDKYSRYFIADWVLSPRARDRYEAIKNTIGLRDNYVAVHIRRGDKLLREAKKVRIADYFSYVDLYEYDQIFVATDDYEAYNEVKSIYPNIDVVTNASKSSKGHTQAIFNSQSEDSISEDLYDLIAEVEILRCSKYFIGSFTSNIGRYVHILRSGINSSSVDIEFSLYYNPYE